MSLTSLFVRTLVAGLLLLAAPLASAFEPFVIDDIRVEGLQRIAVGTVFNYLPLKRGDTINEQASTQAISTLYKTGFFKDVVLEREGDTLIVFVIERPAIASIEISGNEDIPTEQLMENLKMIGLVEGRVFNRSLLDSVEQQLKQQYLSAGKYNVRVESTITPQERNRVAVRIDIAEGEAAGIYHINIIGNQAFTEEALLKKFESSAEPGLFSGHDQYSKQKLAADMETLRSFYMDQGYINFAIDSTQVSISPDKQQVYITVSITEGEQFTVSGTEIAGETVVEKEKLAELIQLEAGDVFSRRKVTESSTAISERLGDEGYAFANINPIPEVDKDKKQVKLVFFVDPGKRVYVRRINISGNNKTHDEVLRRELRQMESAWISNKKIKRSRTRLNRLGYFQDVNVETPSVPGTTDQVDVNFTVKERETFGSLNFGIGYGDTEGMTFNASINEENVFGTGQRFSLSIDSGDVNTIYSMSFTNPYHTVDGVSRSIRFSYRSTDYDEADVSDYTTDTLGAGMTYGIPVSEYNSIRYGFSFENTVIHVFDDTSDVISDFCAANATLEDCNLNSILLNASFNHDTRDRAFFPTEGNRQSIGLELATSAGNMNYYKLSYGNRNYWPVTEGLTLTANADLSYGDIYGETELYPPFEKYYAGGVRNIRGYRPNSLGTEATKDEFGDPLGGNARIIGNLELVFLPPFAEDPNTPARMGLFVDAGNVFDTEKESVDLNELRYTTGASLVWMSPVGAMTFAYSWPLNEQDGDETERFQFSLGTVY